ncbi:MAG: nucleotidyltransferase domain-containing protein [Candidatus Woesearchaeota archaeon]
MSSKLIAYATDFVSFLIQKTKDKNNIKNIVLYGSVAREESSKGSDIDLFVDVLKNEKELDQEIKKILNLFLESSKQQNYWKPLGIENEIKVIVGKLKDWKELHSSIISNGIILFGKYQAEFKGKSKVLFAWENIHPNSIRVLFNKQLFGYKQKGKFYFGLMQKYNGERLGKGSIVVPLENSLLFHQLFKKYKITVKIKKLKELE